MSNGFPDISTGQAILGSTGLNVLSGAFGGGSSGAEKRAARRSYKYAHRYQPWINSAVFDARMGDFKKHGIHPLFGLGATTGSASPAFGIPGQSEEGSFAQKGLKAASAGLNQYSQVLAQKDLIEAQNTASALRMAEANTSNDNVSVSEQVKSINPHLQEFKKGEVVAHDPKSKQKGMGRRPLTNAITIGDQDIQFAVEEAADIMEDPVKIIGLAMLDRNNKGVQWRKAIRDYAGMAHPRDYKARNLAERVITKSLLWGALKYKRHYKIPRYMGR